MKAPAAIESRIQELLGAPPRHWRVSLFMPAHRAGPEVRQGPIRLRNLLREAETQLRACEDGLREEHQKMLEPASELIDDEDFWNQQEGGLALFLDEDGMQILQVPDELAERCVVSERFHLKPLLPRLVGDTTFYLLALSRNRVALHRASRDVIEEMDLGDIPESLEHALGFEKQHDSQQGHVGHRQGGAGHVQPHGHGEGDDDRARELRAFLHKVDAGLQERIGRRSGPILLAGVAEVVSTFRQGSRLADRILEPVVEGNVDAVSAKELHDRAWPLVEETLEDDLPAAVEEYRKHETSDRAVHGTAPVVKAAVEGRLRTVLVALDQERWGRIDEERHEVHEHDSQQPGDEDLVDRVAQLGRQRGARVVLAVAQDMPTDEPLAGILHA